MVRSCDFTLLVWRFVVVIDIGVLIWVWVWFRMLGGSGVMVVMLGNGGSRLFNVVFGSC